MGIELSAQMVNATIVFEGFSGNMSEVFQFYIRNDEIGLENVEVFEIQIIESFPINGVILGESLEVFVVDDDGI